MDKLKCESCEWCHGFCYRHEIGKLPVRLERMEFYCGFRSYMGYDPVRRWYVEHDKDMPVGAALIGYSNKNYNEKTARPNINEVPKWCPKRRSELAEV